MLAGVAACNRAPRSEDPPPRSTDTTSSPPTVAAAVRSESRIATLERTPCYGTCPVYKVTLHSDGSVSFEGTRNVSVTGVRTWRVPADSAAIVFRFADSVRFASFPARYDFGEPGCSPYIADLPGYAVTVETAGTSKRVYTDAGCPNIPRALAALPALIDRVAKVESAVGKPN